MSFDVDHQDVQGRPLDVDGNLQGDAKGLGKPVYSGMWSSPVVLPRFMEGEQGITVEGLDYSNPSVLNPIAASLGVNSAKKLRVINDQTLPYEHDMSAKRDVFGYEYTEHLLSDTINATIEKCDNKSAPSAMQAAVNG